MFAQVQSGQLFSPKTYQLDLFYHIHHKSPYIDALLEHGFETDVTYDRFFNRETGERVFLDYAIDSLNIVMFVSLMLFAKSEL